MKKILLIMIAVVWVGLSTYPAYADNGKKDTKTEQQSQPKENVSNNQPADSEKQEGKNNSTAEQQTQQGENESKGQPADNKKPEDKSSDSKLGPEVSKKGSTINEFNLLITVAVGILLLLVIFLLFKLFKQDKALRGLYYRVNENIRPKLRELEENVNKIKNQDLSELSKKIETVRAELHNLIDALEQEKQQLAKAEQEVVVEPKKPAYVEKVMYGKYMDVDNGFDKKYLNEVKEDADQCEIRLKSDYDATFSLLPGKSNTLLKEALNACEILEGDPESFNSYHVIEDGRLTLQDGIWQVREKVKIKLM